MARPRVLQLVSGFAVGDQMGGAEQFGLQLARHLNKEKFETVVCGVWYYGTASERKWIKILQNEGIQHVCLARPTGSLVVDFRRAISRLWSIVSLLQPSIINSHSEHADTLNMLTRLMHPAAPKAIRTMHTDQQWQDRPWLGKLLIDLIFPFVFDAEVAISQSTQAVLDQRILAAMLQRKAFLIYNGIDEQVRHKHVAPLSHPSRPEARSGMRRIAIIGRLEQQKGHTYLLEAVQQLVTELPLQLYIIGTGSLQEQLQAQAARLQITDVMHFMGRRDDVLELLPQFDLVVSASLWEGFPTVLLEAMNLGVPIIATDVSGSRELIMPHETGALVPVADPESLVEALRTTFKHYDHAVVMARRAKEHVAKFTIQAAAEAYEQLYTTITT